MKVRRSLSMKCTTFGSKRRTSSSGLRIREGTTPFPADALQGLTRLFSKVVATEGQARLPTLGALLPAMASAFKMAAVMALHRHRNSMMAAMEAQLPTMAVVCTVATAVVATEADPLVLVIIGTCPCLQELLHLLLVPLALFSTRPNPVTVTGEVCWKVHRRTVRRVHPEVTAGAHRIMMSRYTAAGGESSAEEPSAVFIKFEALLCMPH
mmetsp:Transcript_4927/g.9109  ORF Transcript_4927/g.9109 Transcript_4927/m.9109 type:complete len:210 (+) Transcript_4927:778-1407(+)